MRYLIAVAVAALVCIAVLFCGHNDTADAYPAYIGGLGSTGVLDSGGVSDSGSDANDASDSGSDSSDGSEDSGPPLQCCTGGFGSVPLSCSDAGAICLVAMNFSDPDAGQKYFGYGLNQVRSHNDWTGQGELSGLCINPANSFVAPCIGADAGCLTNATTQGDASTPCYVQWDAAGPLPDGAPGYDAAAINQQVNIGYVQNNQTLQPPYTIELRQLMPSGAGTYPVCVSTYTNYCKYPDLTGATHNGSLHCQQSGPDYYGPMDYFYLEYEFCEWLPAILGPGGYDLSVDALQCDGNTNELFAGVPNPTQWHTIDGQTTVLSDGGAGCANTFIDGVLTLQICSHTGGNFSDGGTAPGCGLGPNDGGVNGTIPTGPSFFSLGFIMGFNGGTYDAGALPGTPGGTLYQQQTQFINVTSP